MLDKKIISLVVNLAIIALLVFILLQAAKGQQLTQLRDSFKYKSKIILDNMRDSVFPTRRAPLATIELEENLKKDLAVPFATFTEDDWRWFWRLLYGRFTQDQGIWPRRRRQLSREEIEDALVDYYYRPFGTFRQQQWNIFWQQILKGKVF